ncbi:MAG: undecaprenyldiphospho-muramoylpentapeptide beta-N-acetylglucosaminyltransferase [Vulcanimicrobiaceae bacterium]
MNLVLTGGGTGGHVYPALALAEAFARDPACAPLTVTFVGTRAGLEATIVPKAGGTIRFVRAAPLVRRFGLSLVRTLATNLAGFVDALRVLHAAKPDVLVATGGYVSLPVVAALRAVVALRRSRARIAVLEPNAVAGLTNRLLAPLVDEVWYAIAPPGRALGARERLVGIPVRASMRERLDAREARTALGLDPDKTTVVIMGGRQGARSINEAVAGAVEAGVPADWQLLVLAGARDYAAVRARLAERRDVTVLAYLDDPHAAYAAADVVVARAGASTLGELAATATPALLVPYPFATDDHQTHNARAFAAHGAARVVADGELDAARLRYELETMLAAPQRSEMRAAARAAAGADPATTIVARVKAWSAANPSTP